MQQASTTLQCGAPHFRSIAKQHRHANYNLEKAINELIDNVIKLTNIIHIITEIDSEGRLQEIKISDNYALGFVNILEQGTNNPFNMGHIKSGHDDDNETSEFGCGGKAASISASNHMYIVTKVNDRYYEVVCDFIKMEREDDVIASYNPKLREIFAADYHDIHPFETGSSIVLSKILGTICEQTTQQKLTQRIKTGISETYSRFLKENMDIRVNGDAVEREIDFFWDPKCMPFTIKKSLFILTKPGTSEKIFLIQKTLSQTNWQQYNKIDDKWIAFKSIKDADDFRETKFREGYTYSCQQLNGLDESCLRIESTFVFYSDLVHLDDASTVLPQDQVLIYKDNRKYGKKSLVKHNNGIHNYTLHKVEFSSKKIGKELGITFNKEITMDGNNDLIAAIKSAIKDNRSEFNSDTASATNKKLCDKAIKNGVIDLMTCVPAKLSKTHREQRELLEGKNTVVVPTKVVPTKVVSTKVIPTKVVPNKVVPNKVVPTKVVPTKVVPTKVVSTKVVPNIFCNDDISDTNDTSDYSSSEESSCSNASNMSLTIEDVVISDTPKVIEELFSDNDLESSKAILIKISQLILDQIATDNFNIKLENSHALLEIVQKYLV
jgi:hypothetical protein